MKRILSLTLLLSGVIVFATAQQSDFAIKKNFEDRFALIAAHLDSSRTVAQIDSLKAQIDKLETDFTPHRAFLDKALYPSTYAESIAKMRSLQVLTYDRVYLINTQGIKLSELEARVALLTTRLDSLTAQRDQLFGELQESKKSVAALREAMKRLTANLQAKDRLIFAIVDSIFLPYGKDLNQVADLQKEAIGRRLEKANVVTRVYEIAADNVKFLEVTQLQGKDYGNIIDQYQAFATRWNGLKEKMSAVAATNAVIPTETPGTGTVKSAPRKGSAAEVKVATETATAQAGQVDSVLTEWRARLTTAFWSGLQKEIATAGATVGPFTNGPTFSASIRAYVAELKAGNQDPTPFVETVWKQKIDKDWREALSKESMLGRAEYASLDKLVSELSKDMIDARFLAYVAGIIAILIAIWFFVFRKKKTKEQPVA